MFFVKFENINKRALPTSRIVNGIAINFQISDHSKLESTSNNIRARKWKGEGGMIGEGGERTLKT